MKSEIKIIANSPQRLKASTAYKQKVEEIKKVMELQYKVAVQDEKNLFRKVLLMIRKNIETRKAIKELTSPDKLFIS